MCIMLDKDRNLVVSYQKKEGIKIYQDNFEIQQAKKKHKLLQLNEKRKER